MSFPAGKAVPARSCSWTAGSATATASRAPGRTPSARLPGFLANLILTIGRCLVMNSESDMDTNAHYNSYAYFAQLPYRCTLLFVEKNPRSWPFSLKLDSTRREIITVRGPILCLASSKILTPSPGEFVAGGGHTRRVERGCIVLF